MVNCVQLFAIPWTVVHQASLSMEFYRQEYWSGLPLPTLRALPDPGIKPGSLASLALTGRLLTTGTTIVEQFILCQFLLHIFCWSVIRYINVYTCLYIFALLSVLLIYTMKVFVSYKLFWLKVWSVLSDVSISTSALLVNTCMEYPSPSFCFQTICVLGSKVNLFIDIK